MLRRLITFMLLVDRAIVTVGGPSILGWMRRHFPRRIPAIGAALGWALAQWRRGPSLPHIISTITSFLRRKEYA